jgi:hypothetical protein
VAQGRLEELRIPVPAGFEVVGVKGPIAGWNVVDGKVVVTPLAPVESSLAVELELTGEPRDLGAAASGRPTYCHSRAYGTWRR